MEAANWAISSASFNLAALQVGAIYPAAIIGEDGEGFELKRALGRVPGLRAVWIVESR